METENKLAILVNKGFRRRRSGHHQGQDRFSPSFVASIMYSLLLACDITRLEIIENVEQE
jgi:hypothetical protein